MSYNLYHVVDHEAALCCDWSEGEGKEHRDRSWFTLMYPETVRWFQLSSIWEHNVRETRRFAQFPPNNFCLAFFMTAPSFGSSF